MILILFMQWFSTFFFSYLAVSPYFLVVILDSFHFHINPFIIFWMKNREVAFRKCIIMYKWNKFLLSMPFWTFGSYKDVIRQKMNEMPKHFRMQFWRIDLCRWRNIEIHNIYGSWDVCITSNKCKMNAHTISIHLLLLISSEPKHIHTFLHSILLFDVWYLVHTIHTYSKIDDLQTKPILLFFIHWKMQITKCKTYRMNDKFFDFV